MSASKERMLRVLSKYQKVLKLKDIDGEEIEFTMYYPSFRNSEDFWDIVYIVMQHNDGEVDTKSITHMELMKDIIPKIISFIIKGNEERTGELKTPLDEQFVAVMVQSNLDIIMNGFMDMANRMIGAGDAPKNLTAAQLQKE